MMVWGWLSVALAGPGDTHQEILDNGLRVVLVEHHANPMVATAVAVGAGAIYEGQGQWGASHFLEHLLFNGTETRTQRELYDEVDRYGAYNNASTHSDHTLFTLLIHKDYARQGLDIQSDMLFHSTIPAEKFEKERGIVLEELARGQSDESQLTETAFAQTAWAGTPLAHSVLGTTASLEGIERDAVLAYYHARYTPKNMTLFVTGDFETESMLAMIRETFGRAPATEAPPLLVSGSFPSVAGFEGPSSGGHSLRWAVPLEIGPEDPRLAAVHLLVSAATSGTDAPLSRALTGGQQPLVLSWSMAVQPRSAPWTTLEFEATLPEVSHPDAVLAEIERVLRDLGPSSPSRDRLDAVRAEAEAEDVLTRDRIHYVGPTRSWALLAPGQVRLDGGLSGVDTGALDEASALLSAALPRARAGLFAPGLEAGPHDFAAVASEPKTAAPSLTRLEKRLPSGLQLYFEQHTGSEVFGLHIAVHPGSAADPEGKAGIATVLHRMLLEGSILRGTEALDRAIRDLGAEVKLYDDASIPFDDYYSRPEFGYLRLQLPAARWRAAIDLLPEILLHPRFDPDDLEAVKAVVLEEQRQQGGQPSKVASRALLQALAPSNPAAAPVLGTAASVSSITVDDLGLFHASYMTGLRMLVTATGPMDPADFEAALAEAFADLPSGAPAPAMLVANLTDRQPRVELTLGKAQSQITLGALLDVRPEDREALTVAVAMLSDRLMFSLREEQGLAYSVGTSAAPFAGRWLWTVGMGTRPESVDKALVGLLDGIESFRKGKPSPQDVLTTANAIRGQSLMRRMTRVGSAYAASMALLAGRSPSDEIVFLDALPRVSPSAVRAAAKRYLSPKQLTEVIVR